MFPILKGQKSKKGDLLMKLLNNNQGDKDLRNKAGVTAISTSVWPGPLHRA